jgi:hypothetical protein
MRLSDCLWRSPFRELPDKRMSTIPSACASIRRGAGSVGGKQLWAGGLGQSDGLLRDALGDGSKDPVMLAHYWGRSALSRIHLDPIEGWTKKLICD